MYSFLFCGDLKMIEIAEDLISSFVIVFLILCSEMLTFNVDKTKLFHTKLTHLFVSIFF